MILNPFFVFVRVPRIVKPITFETFCNTYEHTVEFIAYRRRSWKQWFKFCDKNKIVTINIPIFGDFAIVIVAKVPTQTHAKTKQIIFFSFFFVNYELNNHFRVIHLFWIHLLKRHENV